MHKSFYIFANFFLGLSTAAGLLQSIIYFQLGAQIFTLPSFADWFLLVNIVYLVGSSFILKYYHYMKYWFTFITGTIAIIAILCQVIIFYIMLVARELQSFYIPVLMFSLGAGIVYALSLIFSKAGRRFWLKTAGVFMFIIGLASVSIFIWSMNSPEVQINSKLEKINQWISLASSFVPLLYIINFVSEGRIIKEETAGINLFRYAENALSLVAFIVLILTLVLGVSIAHESSSSLYWQKRNAEKTQALVQLSEARTFVSSKGDTLQYLLLKPQDYDSKKEYPLVVNLPYGGYEGAEIAQLLSIDANRRNYPAFLFIPYCPPGSGWGGVPNYPDVASLVFEAIHALDEEFAIDAKRRYVTGISRGGYGSWHFISMRPEMFAAAIPVCGAGDPQYGSNIVDVAVWAFHGEKDRNVPVSGSRDMIEAMKKAGGKPRYTEFPDEGHNIWHRVRGTPGLLDWLFTQKRDSLK